MSVATYQQWNRALIEYFTETSRPGDSLFLSVDEEVLSDVYRRVCSPVGQDAPPIPHTGDSAHPAHLPAELGHDALPAFRSALQRVAVASSARVSLLSLRGLDDNGQPRAAAFLCAMVLAASMMADEEQRSQMDYFGRLRQVLGLSAGTGRIDGMGHGAEEELWLGWNRWVRQQGYVPTAHPGEGPTYYIDYPILQCLLRKADKDRLRRLFDQKHWTGEWDPETLFTYVRAEASTFGPRLRRALTSSQHPQRLEALSAAIYDVYESWLENPTVSHHARSYARARNLLAGLYRVADPITGEVNYFAYPRRSRRQSFERVEVEFAGEELSLSEDRPGWFAPFGPVTASDLDEGQRYVVRQPSDVDSVILPERQFWVLVPDPEDPMSGVYASWGAAPLGVPVILLCHRDVLPQLNVLQDQQLIRWEGEPRPTMGSSNWVELRECIAVLEDWSGVSIANLDLLRALQPKGSVGLSLSGGLKVPGEYAWVEEHGPLVRISGFRKTADIRIVRALDDRVIFDETRETGTEFPVDWGQSGNYLIEAECGGSQAIPRVVRLVAWCELRVNTAARDAVQLGAVSIAGAVIRTEAS